MRLLRRGLLFKISVANTLQIVGNNSYTGREFLLTCLYNGYTITPTWSIDSGNQYASINSNGKVTIDETANNNAITVKAVYLGNTITKQIYVTYGSQLNIEISNVMTGTSDNAVARFNGEVVTPTWSIIEGSSHATIASDGTITIISDGSVTISATYNGYTTTKTVTADYQADATSSTTVNEDGSVTTETTTTTTDTETGATITTTSSNTIYEDGSSSSTETETTQNQDGSSTSISETTNSDGTSSTKTSETNSDGSSSSTLINYDENGDPTDKTNEETDTSGNVNTQNIEFDENGNEVVTGYDIDTSSNPQGSKNYNNDGLNTEFYALDVTQGFIMDIHFTIDFTQQPPNQNDGHHNIINSKRATPEPWYGFQVRQSQTNKYIQLGTQFATGSNLNQTITTTNANKYNGSSNVYEYNIHIVYDPTTTTNKFTCDELIGGYNYTANNTFPDIEDLKYIKTTVGCALDADGKPFRFSNINVFAFSIEKLKKVKTPEISCDGREVTITCETAGATIYYRLKNSGSYTAYTTPISINADTVVQAYGELNGDRSNTATETCYYDNGIATPVITCDGEYVSIACATTDATLYYRLNETGTFSEYTEPFEINATTVVEAYAETNGERGHTAKETCTYAPVVLVAPVILCNGEQITITCATQSATINYRLNQEGTYQEYTTPITILQDTFVEAYSTYRGRVSSVVSETCEYSPVHHYENDYLTFRARTAGKVYWHSNGSGQAKTIDYSLNGGTWTSITATDTSTYFNVAANDVVRFRGTNLSYAKDKSNYSGFGQGEHGTTGQSTYDSDAAEVDIEGNIMSLIYGDNFVGQTTFNGGTYNFCSMFKKLKVVSAENLILPALTLREACYRAMFSWCTYLEKAPQLPATTLANYCYWYMFEKCAITTAPDLLFETFVNYSCGSMFTGCASLNFIKCMAINGFSATQCKQGWTTGVASSGTFVKDSGVSTSTWTRGANGIPTSWLVYDDVPVTPPTITYDGFSEITLTCDTQGATIYYKLNNTGSYATYSTPITISGDTVIQTYSELNGVESRVDRNCRIFLMWTDHYLKTMTIMDVFHFNAVGMKNLTIKRIRTFFKLCKGNI